MAGILNNKERMLDFIITQNGRSQAALGQLQAKFASFTDYHTFYARSGTVEVKNLAEDASARIFFEATSRFQDTIVPEIGPNGTVNPFRTSEYMFTGNTVLTGAIQQKGLLHEQQPVTLAQATGSIDTLVSNFTDLRIIGTKDEFALNDKFAVDVEAIKFNVTANTIFAQTQKGDIVALENAPSFFLDDRFGHYPNFKYLPPENYPEPGAPTGSQGQRIGKLLGRYPQLVRNNGVLTYETLVDNMKQLGAPRIDIKFIDTSKNNNIVAQVFEFSGQTFEKLSIVDFGAVTDDDPLSPGKHVYFVGKFRRDSSGGETFLNLFTMVFD